MVTAEFAKRLERPCPEGANPVALRFDGNSGEVDGDVGIAVCLHVSELDNHVTATSSAPAD